MEVPNNYKEVVELYRACSDEHSKGMIRGAVFHRSPMDYVFPVDLDSQLSISSIDRDLADIIYNDFSLAYGIVSDFGCRYETTLLEKPAYTNVSMLSDVSLTIDSVGEELSFEVGDKLHNIPPIANVFLTYDWNSGQCYSIPMLISGLLNHIPTCCRFVLTKQYRGKFVQSLSYVHRESMWTLFATADALAESELDRRSRINEWFEMYVTKQ